MILGRAAGHALEASVHMSDRWLVADTKAGLMTWRCEVLTSWIGVPHDDPLALILPPLFEQGYGGLSNDTDLEPAS